MIGLLLTHPPARTPVVIVRPIPSCNPANIRVFQRSARYTGPSEQHPSHFGPQPGRLDGVLEGCRTR
jgi:hypothetical protein